MLFWLGPVSWPNSSADDLPAHLTCSWHIRGVGDMSLCPDPSVASLCAAKDRGQLQPEAAATPAAERLFSRVTNGKIRTKYTLTSARQAEESRTAHLRPPLILPPFHHDAFVFGGSSVPTERLDLRGEELWAQSSDHHVILTCDAPRAAGTRSWSIQGTAGKEDLCWGSDRRGQWNIATQISDSAPMDPHVCDCVQHLLPFVLFLRSCASRHHEEYWLWSFSWQIPAQRIPVGTNSCCLTPCCVSVMGETSPWCILCEAQRGLRDKAFRRNYWILHVYKGR